MPDQFLLQAGCMQNRIIDKFQKNSKQVISKE
jgi:hypothetical protein